VSWHALRLRPRLALGALAAFVVAVPLTLLALSVRAGWAPVRAVDQDIANGLHEEVLERHWLVDALRFISVALDPWVFRVVVLALVIVLIIRGALRLAWWAAITMAVGGVLGFVLKLVTARARPRFDLPVMTAQGFSFPSGHALNSAVGTLVIVLAVAITSLGKS
jgi:undecaprenyl-diphosphatase